MPAQPEPPIREAVTASTDLVCVLCAPAVEHGIDAPSCRVLLHLAESGGHGTTGVAEHVGALPAEAERWLETLEQAGLVRCERGAFELTRQGYEVAAQLRVSACPERFASLQAEIASLRDLLCQALVAVERRAA